MSSCVSLSPVVCNVRPPYSDYWNFRQCLYAIWYLGYLWPFDKGFTEIVLGEPLRRGLNQRGVAKYSDFRPFQGSKTVQDRSYVSRLLITNRKSHVSFRLVPKLVTLNDLERRDRPNGCLISPNSVAFWADCVKVVEDTQILSAAEM